MSESAKPRPAATVILLRRAEPIGFEVFLTRRPDTMPFLGGMYCYPGGSVTKSDSSVAMLQRCVGLAPEAARKIVGAEFSPGQAVAYWVAAIRELFEEVGILYAVTASRTPWAIHRLGAGKLGNLHQSLLGNTLTFTALLDSQDLYVDCASLMYFSHWQTPAHVATRFETRFFISVLPDGQVPLNSSYEVVHSVWLAPDQAMALHDRGELPMIFPTYSALRTLADFDTLEAVLAAFRSASRDPGSLEAPRSR